MTELNDELLSLQQFLQAAEEEREDALSRLAQAEPQINADGPSAEMYKRLKNQRVMIETLAADLEQLESQRAEVAEVQIDRHAR